MTAPTAAGTNASPVTPPVCPRCAGEGCSWCDPPRLRVSVSNRRIGRASETTGLHHFFESEFVGPPLIHEILNGITDEAFARAWPKLNAEHRRAIPEAIGQMQLDRWRRLTNYVDGTGDRLRALDARRGREKPDHAATNLSDADLLDTVHVFLGRFVAYPSPAAQIAHTLWIAHTHLMDQFESTPRIAFLSPERGSGKTRALEVSETLVPRPILAINVTSPYIFRKISDPAGRPTILYDEIDTVFGPKAKEHEDIRAVLNAGHRRSGSAGRCVVRGKVIETEELSAYCAVALAGIGDLPDTILSRSIVIGMKRRSPDEIVAPFRARDHVPEGNALRNELAAWATQVKVEVPEMPAEVTDRSADVWEPLIAIADAAGGEWPERARVTAVTFVTLPWGDRETLGVRLLTDLRTIFSEEEVLHTKEILEKLAGVAALRALAERVDGQHRGLGARGVRVDPRDARRRRLRPAGRPPRRAPEDLLDVVDDEDHERRPGLSGPRRSRRRDLRRPARVDGLVRSLGLAAGAVHRRARRRADRARGQRRVRGSGFEDRGVSAGLGTDAELDHGDRDDDHLDVADRHSRVEISSLPELDARGRGAP
jgi:hypothetical protein